MHENRFFIRAGNPPAKAQGIRSASAGFTSVNGCIVHNNGRPSSDRVPALVAKRNGRSNPLGAGPHVAPRERADLYTGLTCVWRQACSASGPRQPSTRCALGDGGRGVLRGAVSSHRRNPRRASITGFHRDQAFGHARRGFWRTRFFTAQRRSGCTECCARTLACDVPAITDECTRQQSPRLPTMGSGFISRPRPNAGTMGGAI